MLCLNSYVESEDSNHGFRHIWLRRKSLNIYIYTLNFVSQYLVGYGCIRPWNRINNSIWATHIYIYM